MVEALKHHTIRCTGFPDKRNLSVTFAGSSEGVQQIRAAAEREAINTPIQGTAADLIKIAMIEVYKELKKLSPETKMLLQVHDELVFEVPEQELKKVAKVIDDKM